MAQILDSDVEVTEQILVQDLEENDDFSIADHNLNVSPMKTNVSSPTSPSLPKVSELFGRRRSKRIVCQPKRLIEEM